MIEKRKKSQKGAISIFVMLAMMFFLITIMGIYSISAKRAQTQTESIGFMQKQYYNEIENDKIADSTEMIPLYTKEQFWSVGNGGNVEIDGKIYDFSQANLNQYELKNDIVINLQTDLKNAQFKDNLLFGDNTIQTNNCEVLYYYKGNYYVPFQYSDGIEVINLNQENQPVLSASGDDFSIIHEQVTDLVGKYYLFALKNPIHVSFDYNYLENNLWENGNDVSNYYSNYATIRSREMRDDLQGLKGRMLQFTFENSFQTSWAGLYVADTKLESNKTYTWSVELKTIGNINMWIGQEQGGFKTVPVTSEWQRITHTFTATERNNAAFMFYTDGYAWLAGDTLSIRSLQLAETDSLNVKSYDMAYGATLENLETPTREGDTFLGWYTEPVGGEPITSDSQVYEDITYYAHWEYNHDNNV